ncbi:cytochrome P450 4C1-like, partial [Diaphorina citri]|uniref:Cytochrome P450 4C1-like n=1 Tax=Diaphorina citri TaxID=121845 RepID=A0A1S3DS23_DIACI
MLLVITYICIFFEETNILVDKFRPLMEKGESFYPGTMLNLATFDMVIRSTLGENPKAQDFNDHPVVEAMNKITETARKSVYVEMIIKESLRLYPPVPVVGRQIITDERYEGEDLELPRGASMIVNIYTLHRDSTYYPEPNKFDPDRFLPGEAAKRPVGSYVP